MSEDTAGNYSGLPKQPSTCINLGETIVNVDDDLVDIKAAVLPIASRWYELGECLRLKASDLEALQSSHLSVERALTEVLKLWLRQVYNVQRFGPPTWSRLAEVVGDSSGGKDPALAERIVVQHFDPAAHTNQLVWHHWLSSSLCSTTEARDTLLWYADYLRHVYAAFTTLPSAKKSPISSGGIYINLAIEEKITMSRQEARNDRIEAVLEGNITKILRQQSPVSIEDVLKPKQGQRLKHVLVEGAPGAGKSTFVWKLCREWGEGKILQEYQLVVLLRLQDRQVQTAESLMDIFFHDNKTRREKVFEAVTNNQGEDILIIFDGIDEFPNLIYESTVFSNLTHGLSLPKSTILITTRPSGSLTIYEYLGKCNSRHIEILGFLPKDVEKYYRQVISTDDVLDFEDYLSVHPHIKGMMYIPLFCAIVTEVYGYCKFAAKSTPNTITELYTSLCLVLLMREANIRTTAVSSFDSLPEPTNREFREVCRIAFEMVQTQTASFTPTSLDTFNHLGFMQSFTELYAVHKTSVSYCFLHHTVQEFLAAVHISKLSGTKQKNLLKIHHKQFNFAYVWRFFAGLTKFKAIGGWKTVQEICFDCSENYKASTTDITELTVVRDITTRGLHWLYETQDIHGTDFKILGESTTTKFRSQTALTPFDCLALGTSIVRSWCPWELTLSGDQIKEDEIKILVTAMTKPMIEPDWIERNTCEFGSVPGHIRKLDLCIQKYGVLLLSKLPNEQISNITEVQLRRSNLDLAAAIELKEPLKNMENLEIINLSYNPLREGGAVHVVQAMLGLEWLSELHLRDTEIGFPDCASICSLLKRNKLTLLDVSENHLSPDSISLVLDTLKNQNGSLKTINLSSSDCSTACMNSLALMLEKNWTLEALYLWDCGITDGGIASLAEVLSEQTTVQKIDLTGNKFGKKGATYLANCFKENRCVEEITLCKNVIGEEGTRALIDCLQVNPTLRELKLPEEYQKLGECSQMDERIKWSSHI